MGPGAEMVLDIAGAYGTAGLLSLKRHFVFDPPWGGLKLEDRFVFSADPLPLTERFISLYPPGVEKDGPYGARIDTGDSQSMLRCSLPAAPLVHEGKHRDHYGNEITVYLIDFSFVPEGPEFSVGFEIV
jgi:hypothetical protein